MDKPMLSSTDLILPYTEWKERLKEVHLTEDEKKWLDAWELHDLMVSPMNDKERQTLRYGHYIGWFDCKNYTKQEKEIERLNKEIERLRDVLEEIANDDGFSDLVHMAKEAIE